MTWWQLGLLACFGCLFVTALILAAKTMRLEHLAWKERELLFWANGERRRHD